MHAMDTERDEKKTADMEDNNMSNRNSTFTAGNSLKKESLSVVKTLLGDCLCQGAFPFADRGFGAQSAQFITVHGIEFIGLGAVVDELTPKERVYDSLEQLTFFRERLISIGYLSFEESATRAGEKEALIETVPLDVWNKNYPNDQSMSRRVKRIISYVKAKNFQAAIREINEEFKTQRSQPNRGNNALLSSIAAHNLGVLHVLAGMDDQSIPLFEEAIDRKRSVFGPDHPEVAVSLDEIGIQFFAREMFEKALEAFNEARRIRAKEVGEDSHHPKMAMVLNNIACCYFQMSKHEDALKTLQEARDILSFEKGASSATGELDLLHVAITHCNYGYLLLRAKKYDEARSIFEEALLIQQSVLGDNHRAIRDTLSNIEFTNAFHS